MMCTAMLERLRRLCAHGVMAVLFVVSGAEAGAADFPPANAVPLSVPFYLEGRLRGMAQALVMPDPQRSYVQAAPVIAALRPVLAEDSIKALEAEVAYGFLPLQRAAAGGVLMKFDEVLVAVVATIPSTNRKQQALQARQRFDPSTMNIAPPSDVSAYLNLRGSQDYIGRAFSGQQEGRQALRMSADGALNLRGWVLEGGADYIERDPAGSWARGDVRLVRDFPDAAVRAAAGDLSYPIEGFQSFQPMLGATVARNFDLQPYRVTEPTGQTSFFLKSPSRVDVLVNGQKVRTLQLDAGPYSIKDFPVVSGSNDVTLMITDATGRTEIKTLDIVSDINLLAAGVSKYAYSIGIVSRIDARRIVYDSNTPAVSAFHRHGVSDRLTLGANLQATGAQQMGGLDVTTGQPWGVVRFDVATSRVADAGSGMAWRVEYQNVDRAKTRDDGRFGGTRNFSLQASYKDRKFAPLGNLLPNNSAMHEIGARYGWQASPVLSVGVSGNYSTYRDRRPDDWGAGIALNRRMSEGFHVGLNLGQRKTEGFGMFLSFFWTERGSRNSFSGSYDSNTRMARADWAHAQDGRADSISASSGIVRTESGTAVNGNIAYFGDHGEIAARHDLATTRGADGATESRSQLRFGTALLYGDGQMALSQPVSNSFVLFVPAPAIVDYPIGINPRATAGSGKTYEAKTEGMTPAVIADLTPYYYRSFDIDSSRLPAGFDAGENRHTVYPGYRSGTVIRLGSDANVMLDGTLAFQDGAPAALQAGSIRSIDAPDTQPLAFFTNRAGRFRIDKLKPGRYAMTLFRFPGATQQIDVPANAAGPTPIGTVVLPFVQER